MPCKSCHSDNQHTYPSEINIHPPQGLQNMDKRTVWAFPSLVVCIECGFVEFVLSEAELNQLQHNQTNYWNAVGKGLSA